MRLQNNHARVLQDPLISEDLNIDGKPPNGLELIRLAPEHEMLADVLCEIERRLLGNSESKPLTVTERQVWSCSRHIFRQCTQSTKDEKPGRVPDMSPCVLQKQCRDVLEQIRSAADPQAAKLEAGRKLRNNHTRVLRDMCNTSEDQNIDGKPLIELVAYLLRTSACRWGTL